MLDKINNAKNTYIVIAIYIALNLKNTVEWTLFSQKPYKIYITT